jgi:hypothetical protein
MTTDRDRVEAALDAWFSEGNWRSRNVRYRELMSQALAAADVLAPPPMTNRDYGGRLVREAWVRWALTQPDPKPSWLVPYEELSEPDKEADRQIAEALWSVRAPPPVPEDVRLVERLTRERDEAREQAHYANGVADLAMKHRDYAEAHLARAREALEAVDAEVILTGALKDIVDRALADSEPAGQEPKP